MSTKVRVRFAPSPTGPLHMGGVRTALYNYLFAKHNGGDFLLRIEDTDQSRYVEGAEAYILESLKWCGLQPDEGLGADGGFGPYRQSERNETGLYREHVMKLIEEGKAYYAFDTPEELEQMREDLKQGGGDSLQYDAVSRLKMKNSITLSEEEVRSRIEGGEPYVVRIKIPENETIAFTDLVRGDVTVNSSNLDDKVLYKSDGMPTYHLANVVDDHAMQISHVIRGEEWLPSAPLHVLLYKFLGWENDMPEFAHLPLILKPDGHGKLSKRDGDRLGFPVFPLEWKDPSSGDISSGYRENGYYPEAFVNMLAFLGWNPGTEQEIFSLKELVKAFTLERVGKAGAKFDPEKTKWFNEQYLRTKSGEELSKELQMLLDEKGIDYSTINLAKYCEFMKERASFIEDLVAGSDLFNPPESYDEKTTRKKWKEQSAALLKELGERFSQQNDWSPEGLETSFKEFIEEKEVGIGAVLPAFRLALTGKGSGPSMFEIASLIGEEESLSRIDTAIEKLGKSWAK